LEPNADSRWGSCEEFLAAKLRATEAEMATAILNRGRWDRLRDDRRLLMFLQWRTQAADFEGVRAELDRISDGRLRVPELNSPRRKAMDCLALWAPDLAVLDERRPGLPAADTASAQQC
jgi:hypothetical protein